VQESKIRKLPDEVAQDIIAHELGHVYQYAIGFQPEHPDFLWQWKETVL
jgi:hypothetical protein